MKNIHDQVSEFFQDKQIPGRTYQIRDRAGKVRYIDTDTVIQTIKIMPAALLRKFYGVMIALDHTGADMEQFIYYLANKIIDIKYRRESKHGINRYN